MRAAPTGSNAYAIVELRHDSIWVDGRGTVESRILPLQSH